MAMKLPALLARCVSSAAILAVAGCGTTASLASTADGGSNAGGDGGGLGTDGASVCPTAPHELLSDYHFFVGNGSSQQPAAGVVPYDVIAPLFSDHTVKHRFIALPAGQAMTYDPTLHWGFPVGAVVIKTFAYPRDPSDPTRGEQLLETRLLIQTAAGFTAHTYVWNDAQTDARCAVAGTRIPATWFDTQGAPQAIDYRVPNTVQCQRCHGPAGSINPLGLRTRQMNRPMDYGMGLENQVDHLIATGLLSGTVPPTAQRETLVSPTDPAASVTDRARSYMDANCAHCHNPMADARFSGLYLNLERTAPIDLGVCRRPYSAGGTDGRTYDIVPGHPEQSVMIYRVASTDPTIKMPEIPTQTSDPVAVSVLSAWIATLTPVGCPTR